LFELFDCELWYCRSKCTWRLCVSQGCSCMGTYCSCNCDSPCDSAHSLEHVLLWLSISSYISFESMCEFLLNSVRQKYEMTNVGVFIHNMSKCTCVFVCTHTSLNTFMHPCVCVCTCFIMKSNCFLKIESVSGKKNKRWITGIVFTTIIKHIYLVICVCFLWLLSYGSFWTAPEMSWSQTWIIIKSIPFILTASKW